MSYLIRSKMENPTVLNMPSNFVSIITDFTNDLSITFPEYAHLWKKWTSAETTDESEYIKLYEYCLTIYPERFFDILYQSKDMFSPTSEINTQFLPNVEFKLLFSCENISETITKTMWNYLQLVLITIMSGIKDKSNFGESANLFDGIDETELQTKLNETISGLTSFFKNMESKNSEDSSADDSSSAPDFSQFQNVFENMESSGAEMPNMGDFKNMFNFDKTENMPNADELHGHLKGLFDGKIGTLAKELAEELTSDLMGMFDDDKGDIKSTQDVFKKIMKNPKKILELLKTVGGKLDDKMKSGEISQEELMKEAGELIGKMKGMGGGEQFNDIMKNLTKNMGGLGGLAGLAGAAGKNSKFNMNAFTKMTSQQANRDRMRSKLDSKKQIQSDTDTGVLESTNNPKNYVFKMPNEGIQEKSSANTLNQHKSTTTNDDWLDDLEKPSTIKSAPKKSKGKKAKSKK